MVGLDYKVQNHEAANQQPLSSISEEEFLGPGPANPQPYSMAERINRETFMSMWTDSFSISRNKTPAQYLFLEWVMENYRFDYRKTLKNYVAMGRSDRLSSQEKAMFMTAYSQVPKHYYEGESGPEPKYSDFEILFQMDYFAIKFSNPESNGELFAIVDDPLMADKSLKGMSKMELTQIIDRYIRKTKKKK